MEDQTQALVATQNNMLGNTAELEVYCSINSETMEAKKSLLNALETCDVKLNDIVGQEITIKNVYIEKRPNAIDKETGEVKTKYRTIIFDEDGKTFVTGAYGIFNILKKIFTICGTPESWDEPLKVKVIKPSIGNGKTSLSLEIL